MSDDYLVEVDEKELEILRRMACLVEKWLGPASWNVSTMVSTKEDMEDTMDDLREFHAQEDGKIRDIYSFGDDE